MRLSSTIGTELYKSDSQNFGGGPGRGRDFRMSEFMEQFNNDSDADSTENASGTENTSRRRGGFQSPRDDDTDTENSFPNPGDMRGFPFPGGFSSTVSGDTENGFPNPGNMGGFPFPGGAAACAVWAATT